MSEHNEKSGKVSGEIAKHTPGPWAVEGNWVGTESQEGGGIHDSIAAVHPMDPVMSEDGSFEDFIRGPVTEANARLMAAAPALLAALKAMIAEEDRLVVSGDVITSLGELLEAARPVVAKAEGRAS